MSSFQKNQNIILFGTVFVFCGGLLTLSVRNNAQDAQSPATKKAVSVETPKTNSEEKTPSKDRPAVEFYTGGIRGNLFSAPLPPKPKATPTPKAPPKVKPIPVPIVKPPVVVPIVINPFAEWKYTGTVKMNDQMLALLENSGTKEGRYVRVNEAFDGGATIAAITENGVTLLAAGKPYLIAKQMEGSLIPLNAPTGPAPGTPPPGTPPAPGSPPPGVMPLMQTMPGGTITLPNGLQMDAGRARGRNNRLNRRFNQ